MAYTVADNNPSVRHIIVDADADCTTYLDEIKEKFLPGTTVYSIATKKTFMLSHAGSLVDISSTSSTSTATV